MILLNIFSDMEDILIPIVGIFGAIIFPVLACAFLIVRYITQRHTEKMEMIKQGIILEAKKPKGMPDRQRSLRNGLISVGVGLGLLTGYIFTNNGDLTKNVVVYGSAVLLFMGIAYVTFFLLTKDKKDNQDGMNSNDFI